MTTMNQFTVSGNLCADAQIKEFKNTTRQLQLLRFSMQKDG